MGTKTYITLFVIILIGTPVFISTNTADNLTSNDDTLQTIQDAIEEQQADWVAGYNTVFTKDENHIRKFLGALPTTTSETEDIPPLTVSNLPASYDWRDVNGKRYVTAIKNQASCGSCVAFGAAATLEAVIQIETDTIFDCDLSESQLFFCGGGSCNGGWWADSAAEFIETTGVVDELCFPYQSYDMDCDDKQDNWRNRVIKATRTGSISENQHIKEALITYGPLLTTYTVYEDFGSYNGGIYQHVWGGVSGGHAVSIVGYNDDPGYWICKNSWGYGWGESGFFNIKYGECGIDERVYYFDGITGNIQPSKPEIIQPIHGTASLDTTIELVWNPSMDLDGDTIQYSIYLNPGYTVDFNLEPIASGLTTTSYTITGLEKETVYSWQIISEDEHGSQHTDGKHMFSTRKPLSPTINGPTTILPGKTYTYTATSPEQDGSEYYWYIQWGDDTNTGWIGPYNSGESVSIDHSWESRGSYDIKVKYKEDGVESDWGILQIQNTKVRWYYPFWIIQLLLERMSLIF